MTVGEWSLSTVAPGAESHSLAGLADLENLDAEFAVCVLHRDFYCSEDRQQVRHLKRRYDEFEARDAAVFSVLPESESAATRWQKQYHLPFPVVADPETHLGDHFGQETRFGLLGKVHDVVGRMPATVVLDLRGEAPEEVFSHHGRSRTDRPAVDDVVEAIDRAAARETEDGTAESIENADTDGEDAEGAEKAEDAGNTEDTGNATDAGGAVSSPPLRVPPTLAVSDDVWLRRATADDVVPVLRALHGALLDIESNRVREAIAAGEVVVAEDDGYVAGALVLDGSHVEAVAVPRDRRAQGLGRALVETAAVNVDGPLTADFRTGVRGFWEALGFDVEERESRLWGRRPPE